MWILHETAPLSIAAEPITSQPFETIRELHHIKAASGKSRRRMAPAVYLKSERLAIISVHGKPHTAASTRIPPPHSPADKSGAADGGRGQVARWWFRCVWVRRNGYGLTRSYVI
jgi:hypothetical protein